MLLTTNKSLLLSYVQTPGTADSRVFAASPSSACSRGARAAALPRASTATARGAKRDPDCNAKRESEKGTEIDTHMHVYLSVNTHIGFICSKTIFNDLVLPSYIHLSWTCVPEINYWQRDRIRPAQKHISSTIMLIDTRSVLSTDYYCSHGLLGPVLY